MTKRVMVNEALMALLEQTANEILASEDLGQRWADENQTSAITRDKGGWLQYETDHDWKIAFFIWHCASPALAAKLPREQ